MPDYPPLKYLAGRAYAKGEWKESQRGDFFTFRIAVDIHFGDEEGSTLWYSVATNEKLGKAIEKSIRKGTPVVVCGSERITDGDKGKWYNFNAFRVGIVEWIIPGRDRDEDEEEDEDL